ncbi:hypothetical protein K491DRAFT_701607 [Lophiostoma macrostomum CBS 122681]|uniref:Cyclin-D1-binding protein 1-like N-terminal domain-containing protein n=1 Tax=Lophiostoma macrostomum CBS 122681 TaxID=1314788 RepID=A0A6A6TKW9_9PLEO|nr:hypothetical protein K491DRAFT_701607 [Lophiostoma macrostomum CBS 122681]
MPPKPKAPKGANDLRALIDLTKTTQDLLAHFQSSLGPSTALTAQSTLPTATTSAPEPNPLDVIRATTTLLKSHTTTLSLLLLTPPLTPPAIISKIGDVSSGVLSGMVAAASSVAQPGRKDELGELMRGELRAQVRRLLGTWGEVLVLILRFAERRQGREGEVNGKGKGRDLGPTEAEKQDVLSTTGVLWEACDTLLKVCDSGIVGLVVKKAGEWRSVLLDAVEELKEWGEDVDDEDEDDAEGSDAEDGVFGDEDDIFSAANKLGKGDKELKTLLDMSVKRLKMVGILYQAVIKRRLKPFPDTSSESNGAAEAASSDPMSKLDEVMGLLKSIPETVDELASAFYDLDEEEAKQTLGKCGDEAKSVIALVKLSWSGKEDEFTAWSDKWVAALEAS